MKPTDIEVPFDWNDRKIVIHDRVWYVPQLIHSPQHFDFPGWNDPMLFGNENPLAIEYCSGNGDWIVNRAKCFPEINWIALEMKYQRVRKIWSKLKNNNLSNLIIICAEALSATRDYFPPACLSNAYINFPDPWPKNRHAKNRLIQPIFLQQLSRVLKPNGKITFVTDDANYSEWTIKMFSHQPNFTSLFGTPFYVSEMQDYGTSYFEDLWRLKGKAIRYHQFIKGIEL